MFKTPKEFAAEMLASFLGNATNAQRELFNASRAYPNVPCQFFADVHAELGKQEAHTAYDIAFNEGHDAGFDEGFNEGFESGFADCKNAPAH